MLFYQFLVSRNASTAQPFTSLTEARVMLRMDGDVDKTTQEAVRYLEARGWQIDGVRHAQQADSPDEFAIDDSVLHLYDEAADQGIACEIRLLEEPALVG